MMPRFRCKNGMRQDPPKSRKCVSKTLIQTTSKQLSITKKNKKSNGVGISKSKNNKKSLIVNREIIGAGGYGCVYKPYIPCIAKQTFPDNSTQELVSKFMYKSEAIKELNEFKFIHKLDPTNQFHLGLPILCKPDYTDKKLVKELEECIIGDAPIYDKNNKSNYRVLTFPYGGVNLKEFVKYHLVNFTNVREFWNKCVLNLINGLIFFRKNKIIHHDLKPQNILFDSTKMQMKYIDFGLMSKRCEYIKKSINSVNTGSQIFWSYPLEYGFANADVFDSYAMLSPNEKQIFATQFGENIVNRTSKTNAIDIGLVNSHADNVKYVFEYTIPLKDPTSVEFDQYAWDNIGSFFRGLDKIVLTQKSGDFVKNKMGFKVNKTFIEMTADSIDVYGLGFSLQYVLKQFFLNGKITKAFYEDCSHIFYSMFTMNPLERQLNVYELRDDYKKIIDTHFP
jgi:serine/threonine protein kinase